MTTIVPKYLDVSVNRNKESENFNKAFENYWQQVSSVLYKIVGDADLSEDLALEVFLRLYNRLYLLDENENLRGWLLRVSTNLGLNALRSRKRRIYYEEKGGKMDLRQRNNPDPDIEVEKITEREEVRYVLSKLRPREAKILLLRYSGFSYKEISKIIQVSPNSVGTLLARAEKAFKKVYLRTYPERK